MKTEEAIERLEELIEYKEEWREFWKEKGITDYRLCDTELDLEMLRMAVWALKDSMRWIPCAERLPKMHEEVDYNGKYEESDLILICDASEPHPQVYVGYCWKMGDKVWWKTREWKALDKVTAWMPLPEVYSGSEQK